MHEHGHISEWQHLHNGRGPTTSAGNSYRYRHRRILAVGTDDEVRRAGGLHSELIDLQGRTVLPGFIDAHIHALEAAYRSYYIDAKRCTSEDEVAELVRERAAQTPPGRWILGGHWDKNGWPGEHFPTKASLD